MGIRLPSASTPGSELGGGCISGPTPGLLSALDHTVPPGPPSLLLQNPATQPLTSGGAGKCPWMMSCWRRSRGHRECTPHLKCQFLQGKIGTLTNPDSQ